MKCLYTFLKFFQSQLFVTIVFATYISETKTDTNQFKMKQQSVGIVLCALLLTTFGHDVLQRHQIAHSGRVAHHSQPQTKHHLLSRSNTDDGCQIICTNSSQTDGNLTISVNVSASLVAVYNSTAKVALVIDLKANLVGIFNLTTTGGIIIDLKTQSAVQVSGLWEANVSFSAALTVLSSQGLQVWYAKGEKVSSTQIEVIVQLTLVVLSSGEYHVSAKESIAVLIQLSSTLVVSFKSVITVVKSGEFSASITIKKVVELIVGLSTVITNLNGGIQVLVKHGIVLSLDVIFQSKSSLEIVGYIWQQFSGADLVEIFGDLNNSTNVIKIIAGLGGNSTDGVNGLVTVLVQVLAVVHSSGSADRLVAVLIEYFSSNDHSVSAEWNAAVSALQKVIVQYNLSVKLKAVAELLVKIQKGQWVEENVNISAIITALVTFKDNDRLNAIAVVLVLLRARIAIELAVATLVLHFFQLLAVQGGIQIVVLITGIQVGSEYLAAEGIALVKILRSIKIRDVIVGGFGGLFRIIERLPVVGDILVRINAALKAAGAANTTVQGSFSLRISFQVVGQISSLIVAVLRGSFHIGSIHSFIPPHPILNTTETSEGSSNSSESGSSGGSWSVSGGAGGDGGSGGNSSGNASSSGNSGNVSGGSGGGNNVSVGNNTGGNVGQGGGPGGDGGAGGEGHVEVGGGSTEGDDRRHAKGKHARHHKN